MAPGRPAVLVFGRSVFGYWGTGFGNLKPAKGNVLNLRNAPPGQVDFRLSNGAVNAGYHFNAGAPMNNAIWVDVDNGTCPQRCASHPDISVVAVTNDCVTVRNNKVSGPVRLRYQLNVLDSSGQSAPIDPIIEN